MFRHENAVWAVLERPHEDAGQVERQLRCFGTDPVELPDPAAGVL
ncbi:hypothetical protein ACFOSC_11295 [Streptantibioticus rubrisoli]|nr:hypothetical protein [Streptantibioticus rubrisoli]